MSREFFQHRETRPLFDQLEEISQRSGVSRGVAFEDFLHASVCALGHPLMEEEYLKMIEKHSKGERGKRGADTMAEMFGNVVGIVEKTRADVLGDLFQGAITYGERGQFLTPEPICDMMAQMNVPPAELDDDGDPICDLETRRTVNDPCCGSGRMLLAVGKVHPHWHFVGQDVDLRCVRMTAINLALRNHYGHVVHGNSLTVTNELTYEPGRVQVYGNAIRKTARNPILDRGNQQPQQVIAKPAPPSDATTSSLAGDGEAGQLELF